MLKLDKATVPCLRSRAFRARSWCWLNNEGRVKEDEDVDRERVADVSKKEATAGLQKDRGSVYGLNCPRMDIIDYSHF